MKVFNLSKEKQIISTPVNRSRCFRKYNFCLRHIPSRKLKFEELNFYHPLCKIYEIDNKIISTYSNKIKVISVLSYSFLILNPFKLSLMIPFVFNLTMQPYLFLKYLKLKKKNSHAIKIIFLLKNGQQLLIKTFDNSIHLIYINDIKQFNQNNKEKYAYFRTDDKEFILNLNSQNLKYLNDDILSSIISGKNINTNGSYDNYHRLLKTKLEESYKIRAFRKNLNFEFDKYMINKVLFSYNNFLRIKYYLAGNNFQRFYYKKKMKNKLSNKLRVNSELNKLKRSLNIHMYSEEVFKEKFGIDMLYFLAKINSSEDKNQLLELIKRTDTVTHGRKIKTIQKFLN